MEKQRQSTSYKNINFHHTMLKTCIIAHFVRTAVLLCIQQDINTRRNLIEYNIILGHRKLEAAHS